VTKLRSDKLDLTLLAEQLETIKRIRPDGDVQFEGFLIDELRSVLLTAIEFREAIPEAERAGIITRSIFAAARAGQLTAARLKSAIARGESEYLALPLKPLHVYTTLALGWPFVRRTSRLSTAAVSLLHHRPRLVTNALRSDDPGAPPLDEQALTRFQPVRIRLRARTAYEAVERATENLDFLRGLWNWRLNRRLIARIGTQRTPINQILIGPHFTVHHPTGRFAHSEWWFEPAYTTPAQLKSLHTEWPAIHSEEVRVRRLIRRIPYGDDLRRAFVRYARALDPSDHEAAMLRLWGLLEYLTGTTDARYEKLIDRCVFVFPDRRYARLILEHLRAQRNDLVHSAVSSESWESLAFQLKRFVEALFTVHLGIGRHFESLSAACAFFDLPTDPATLRQRMKVLRLCLRFRR
jgi:hypothetical protein